jgi:hypothetical protein
VLSFYYFLQGRGYSVFLVGYSPHVEGPVVGQVIVVGVVVGPGQVVGPGPVVGVVVSHGSSFIIST